MSLDNSLFVSGNQDDVQSANEMAYKVESLKKTVSEHFRSAEGRSKPQPFTARDLMARELPEPKFAVPNLIPEGLTILAAKAKTGKSWLMLGISLEVTSGMPVLGQIESEVGEVLYISLEDNQYRLQTRLRTLLGNSAAGSNLYFETNWRRLDEGGMQDIDHWLIDHPKVRLIIIDTWSRIKPKSKGHQSSNSYHNDYDEMATLKKFADEKRIAILIVSHTRKMPAEDDFDTILGSQGVVAAPDCLILLRRARYGHEGTISVTGRDVREQSFPVEFDPNRCIWSIKGEIETSVSSQRLTTEQAKVIKLFTKESRRLTPKEAAPLLDKSLKATKTAFSRMEKDGLLERQDGTYFPRLEVRRTA